MLNRFTLLGALAISTILNSTSLSAQDTAVTMDSAAVARILSGYLQYEDSVNNAIQYQTGSVSIGGDIATLDVPAGYKYINPEQSNYVLTEVWGNPPGQNSLGIILKENETPFTDSSYAIVLSYSAEGYVDDEDAQDLDYDDLLETMQEDAVAWNEERVKMGYEEIELVGWASQPYYDATEKKLHWAKELKFGESEAHTLNYNIRVLGRKGYLELNFISEMYLLPEVQIDTKKILPSINFDQGHRYSDFNPDLDEVAAYGIGGLIAGKVLAKAGLFAVLLKFWKLIVIGVIGAFAAVKKWLGFKKKENEKPEPPSETA